MRTRIGYARWLALIMVASLALAGCFRSAGEDLPPTQPGGVVLVGQGNTPIVQATLPPQPSNTPALDETSEPTAETATEFPTPIPSLSPFPTLAQTTPTPTASGPTSTPTTAPVVVVQPTFTSPPTLVVMQPTFTSPPAIVVMQPTFTSQPTFTPPPTYTPLPTYTPQPTFTPLATVVAVLPTQTPPPTFTRPAVVQNPGVGPTMTFTPVPFMPLGPTATYTPFAPGQPAVVQPVQPQPTQPVEAIPQPEQPTVTLAAGGQGGPVLTATPVIVAQVATLTPTPGLPQGPTLNPQQLTATQIIYGATATAAFLMGTVMPSPTPFGQQPVQPVQPGQVIQPGQLPPNATLVTATPVGQPGMCAQHLIVIGDTLSRIAVQYGVTTQAVATANNIVNPDLIEAGKTLQIPCPTTPAVTPVPAQPGLTPVPGTTTGQQIYTVVAGDNIYRISLKFNVDMGELVRINGLNEVTMNTIYVGQTLIIPATAVIVATPVPGQPIVPTLTPFNVVVTSVPAGTIG